MKTTIKTVVRTTHVAEICYDYKEGVELDYSVKGSMPDSKVCTYAKTLVAATNMRVTDLSGWCFCLRVTGPDLDDVTRAVKDIERYIGRFKTLVLL